MNYNYEGAYSKSWDVNSLSPGVYAVRATAINKGNKESSLKESDSGSYTLLPASGLVAVDQNRGRDSS